MEPHKSKSGVGKWALIIGIIIILNLFLNYSISLIFREPQYENFCPNKSENLQPTTKATCLKAGGQWNESVAPITKEPVEVRPNAQIVGSCYVNYTCDSNFREANKIYERNAFITLIIAGVVAIILGLFLKISEAVTMGLAFGGVLSLVIASMRYWTYADNILKVVLLAAALLALIWIGIKKFQ